MFEQLLNLLQDPDPILLALGFGILCAVSVILLVVVNALTSLLDIFGGLFAALASLIGGGPAGWFGCLVMIALILGGGVLLFFLATNCGGGADINLCRFWPL